MLQDPFTYDLLEDEEAFIRLQSAWDSLCEELAQDVTVFASHAWYQSWWDHFRAEARLHLFTMWLGDKLVGVAPLMWQKTILRGLPVNTLGFIQNNQSLHNDFIVLPQVRQIFLQKLLQSLFMLSSRWDYVYFRNLSPLSENYRALIEELKDQKRIWREAPTPIDSPFIIPGASWAAYLADRPRRAKKSLNHIRNRILQAGPVTIRNIRTWEEFSACKEELFEVARCSWTEKLGDSMASRLNREFFEALSLRAAAKGWLSVWVLYLSGKMIAVEYHLRAFGREHALRGHFHPDFAPLSPGTFLEMSILNHIHDEAEKVRIYDFCGSFEAYKRKWTETFVPHSDLFIFNGRIQSHLLRLVEFTLVPGLKKILLRLGFLKKPSIPAPPVQDVA